MNPEIIFHNYVFKEALDHHHHFAIYFFDYLIYVTFNFCNWEMKLLSWLSPNRHCNLIFILFSVKAISLENGHGTETSTNKDCCSNPGEF